MEQTSAPLFSAFMQDLAKQLVPLVVAELKTQTNAEGMGMIALDPNNLALPVYTLMQHDDNIRDAIKDLIEDQYNNDLRSIGTKLDELDNKVDDLESKVDDMDSKVDDFDDELNAVKKNTPKVDADDSEFNDAVMTVLRKNI